MNLVLDCRPTFSFWQAGRLSRRLRAHDEEKKKLFFYNFFYQEARGPRLNKDGPVKTAVPKWVDEFCI